MKKQNGFTVIELLVAIIVLVTAGVVFVVQKNNLEATHRDSDRKIAINAIYHNLEEVVYPELKGYPAKIDAKKLRAMDSDLLKDTNGVSINEAGSQYVYEPAACEGNICKHYKLRSSMEREAEFVKTSKH